MSLTKAIQHSDELRNIKADLKSAIFTLEEALKNEHTYSKDYFEAVTKLAALYRDIGNIESAENLYLESVSKAKEADNIPALADLYRSLAFIKLQETRYDEATRYAKDAKELMEDQPQNEQNNMIRANIYALVGNLNYVQREYDLAIEAYKRGLVYARKADFIQREITLTGDLANVQVDLMKYDHALKTIESTLPNANQYYKIAVPQLFLRKGKILSSQEKFDEAIASIQTALDISKKEGWTRDQAEANELMGDVLTKKGELNKAKIAYTEAASIFNKIGLSARASKVNTKGRAKLKN